MTYKQLRKQLEVRNSERGSFINKDHDADNHGTINTEDVWGENYANK